MALPLRARGCTDLNTYYWERWALDPFGDGSSPQEIARRVRGLAIRVMELEDQMADREGEVESLERELDEQRSEMGELEDELGPEVVERAREAIQRALMQRIQSRRLADEKRAVPGC